MVADLFDKDERPRPSLGAVALLPLRIKARFHQRCPELHGVGLVEGHPLGGEVRLPRAVHGKQIGALVDGRLIVWEAVSVEQTLSARCAETAWTPTKPFWGTRETALKQTGDNSLACKAAKKSPGRLT
jgi:hypothetical protein